MTTAVEFEFDAEEWQRLDPSQRVRRCQAFAEQSRQLSVDAAPALKRSYLELSLQWIALADEMERHSDPRREGKI